jgi:hypothetical protein
MMPKLCATGVGHSHVLINKQAVNPSGQTTSKSEAAAKPPKDIARSSGEQQAIVQNFERHSERRGAHLVQVREPFGHPKSDILPCIPI